MSVQQSHIRARRLTVDEDSDQRRLDNYLITLLNDIPHSHIYNLIRTGQVRVNGGRAKPKMRLYAGDTVRVPPVRMRAASRPNSISMELRAALERVIYEDEHLLVIDKPAGIAVHSGSRHQVGLIEALRVVRPDGDKVELVHRLDKDTSGILVLAKGKRTLRELHKLWRRESADILLVKTYTALLKGFVSRLHQTIESADKNKVARHLTQSHRMPPAVGKSIFLVKEHFGSCTLAEIELHTGKTHQARLHAQRLGHPIAGDRKYGDHQFNALMQRFELRRMFLHAAQLRLPHPMTDTLLELESNLPQELLSVILKLQAETAAQR